MLMLNYGNAIYDKPDSVAPGAIFIVYRTYSKPVFAVWDNAKDAFFDIYSGDEVKDADWFFALPLKGSLIANYTREIQ